MNIPENILQQVADEAFLSSNGGMMGLLTCNKEKNHVFWHEERYFRLVVIQHALSNPALAPFLPAAKAAPPAEPEPAAQVPLVDLDQDDIKPGTWVEYPCGARGEVEYVRKDRVKVRGMAGQDKFTELRLNGCRINTSIPDTGRWDENAWRPCSKPAGKEVAK